MLDESTIIANNEPKSPVSEAYRVLRTNIQYSNIDKQLKVIVITSTSPGEGKTTTIANLAVTFAQTGSKVLLIDADLRKPQIHKVFWTSQEVGLTNFLASHENHEKYIRQSSIQNLDLLTSGTIPPNPSELLNSHTMKEFIQVIKDEYDIILLDAPPVGNVTDASIISTFVDGTILVVNSGKVAIEALKRAKDLLNKVNANIIGVVLNNIKRSSRSEYYYYHYYGEDGRKVKRLGKRSKKRAIN